MPDQRPPNSKSFDTLEAIYATALPHPENGMLAYLWHRTNERTQSAWPSQSRMAADWRVDGRTICRWLATLEELDLVTCQPRRNGCGTSNSDIISREEILRRRTEDADVRATAVPDARQTGHPCPPPTEADSLQRTPASPIKSIGKRTEIKSVKAHGTGNEDLLWKSLTSPELREIVKGRMLPKLESLVRDAMTMGPTTDTEANRIRFYAAAYDVTHDQKLL